MGPCCCMRADRYFGSFPKVGIVIPNPAQWLLPEFQDIGRTLQTTLQLPPDATIGHGFTLEPTSDGFLISLPSSERPEQSGLPCCTLSAGRLIDCHAGMHIVLPRGIWHACKR